MLQTRVPSPAVGSNETEMFAVSSRVTCSIPLVHAGRCAQPDAEAHAGKRGVASWLMLVCMTVIRASSIDAECWQLLTPLT